MKRSKIIFSDLLIIRSIIKGQLGFGKPALYVLLAVALWNVRAQKSAYGLFERARQLDSKNQHLRRICAELARKMFVVSLEQSIGGENGNYLRNELALKVQQDPTASFRKWRATMPARTLDRTSRAWRSKNSYRRSKSDNILICVYRNWSFTNRVVDELINEGLLVDTLRGEAIPQPFSMTASNLFLPQQDPIQEAKVNFARLKRHLPDIAAQIEQSNVIFVDWANEAAIWMARMAPPEKRLVIRLHSYEAFSPWVHFIPWGRVDALICVGEHIRAFMDEQFNLSETFPKLEQYVVPNWADPDKWTPEKEPNARHRLTMVGYSSSNKGPISAINVLEELFRLAPENKWELSFVGHDWPQKGLTKEEEEYRDLFLNRVQSCDLNGAISRHEYTKDVGKYFKKAGFVLSASERESQHMTIVEGAMSGCIPVVRRWPLGERWNGAARLYPNALLWDNPRQAAEQIVAFSDEKTWEKARADAHDDALARFSPKNLVPDLRRAICGPLG